MKHCSVKVLIAAGFAVNLFAGAPGIGFAVSSGGYSVAGAKVRGNATVFEGSVLETDATVSRVHLNNGSNVTLGPASRASIFESKVVLERGNSQLRMSPGFAAEAEHLVVTGGAGASAARLDVKQGGLLEVASLNGVLEVKNSGGVLLAYVPAGSAMEFGPSAEDASSIELTGRVTASGNRFFVEDETSHVKFELRGSNLKKYSGKRVHVNGKVLAGAAAEGGVQAVEVASISAAAAAGAGAVAAGVVTGAVSHTAIIAGVAVAGAAAAAGTGYAISSSSDSSVSPSSR